MQCVINVLPETDCKKKVSKLRSVVMLLPGECHFESNHLGMGENVPLNNLFLLKHCWNWCIIRWELYFNLLLLCLRLDLSEAGLQTQCQLNITKWLTDKDHFWSTEISDRLKRRSRWRDFLFFLLFMEPRASRCDISQHILYHTLVMFQRKMAYSTCKNGV